MYICESCERYTLEQVCPKCRQKTKVIKLPTFSIEDKYGEYRRKAKQDGQ
ncbi:RNA-protein complex protein Nop10 [Candidatus Woesearchaeota archaeon]|nr:RNA-protein complex protein Nop10 [Candidatus Woesearchaeota archaeon]MBW3018021.1 RNA-protein complex protein Nop10 [Candidatus Woesearchaeota archaeon]